MSIVENLLEKEWSPEERKITTFLDWSGISSAHFRIYPNSPGVWVIDRVDSHTGYELMSEFEWENFRNRTEENDFITFDPRNEFYRISEDDIDRWLGRYSFKYRPWRDEWVLRRLKYKLHYSNLIAEELGCTRETVQKWCRTYEISYPWRDNELMRELYLDNGLNKIEISRYLNCEEGTVAKWLSKHRIVSRKKNDGIDRNRLRFLFVEQNLSRAECGRKLGCSAGKVRYWAQKYELERKNRKNPTAVKYRSHKGYPCWIPKTEDSAIRVRVHRLAAVAEWGIEAVKGMCIHHKSGIPWDNRLSNLELISNQNHAKLHNSSYE